MRSIVEPQGAQKSVEERSRQPDKFRAYQRWENGEQATLGSFVPA